MDGPNVPDSLRTFLSTPYELRFWGAKLERSLAT